MNPAQSPRTGAASRFSPEEWALRQDLAACYRIVDHLGWSEIVINHITVRLPGPEHHFLINPYGLTYDEVTASNLVKIDLNGNPVGEAAHPVNPAGFVIHSAIHAAREDAICVLHTHTTEGQAVAIKKGGLNFNSFYAAQLYGRVGYHDFEGLSLYEDEKPRLLASLGRNTALILRNHGLLTTGRSIAEAFFNMWRLQRACEVQVVLDSMRGEDNPIPAEIAEKCARDADSFGPGSVSEQFFRAMVRKVERINPSFRS